jgi:hypothetical protein
MLLPGEALLFSLRGMLTATALKWRGISVTVGNLAAAITVRVIVDGAGEVCALAEVASAHATYDVNGTLADGLTALQPVSTRRIFWLGQRCPLLGVKRTSRQV